MLVINSVETAKETISDSNIAIAKVLLKSPIPPLDLVFKSASLRFSNASVRSGAKGFSEYNHMYIP
jgi:hypothetical protein